MLDFSIQTDHVKEARISDLAVVDKTRWTCKIIDFAIPRDSRFEEEEEKTEKYQDLRKGVTEDLECEREDYTIS